MTYSPFQISVWPILRKIERLILLRMREIASRNLNGFMSFLLWSVSQVDTIEVIRMCQCELLFGWLGCFDNRAFLNYGEDSFLFQGEEMGYLSASRSKLRGELAEERVLEVICSLSHLPIEQAGFASYTLDKKGIDIIVCLRPSTERPCIHVPVQVKSSIHGALDWRNKHPECVRAGVIEIIAQWWRSDEDLAFELELKFWEVLAAGRDYTELFKTLRVETRSLLLDSASP